MEYSLRAQTFLVWGANGAAFICVFGHAQRSEDHVGQGNPCRKTASTLGGE